MEKLAAAFGKMMLGIMGVFCLIWIRGLVLVKFWVWFIIPIFAELKPLYFMQAIGLSMFVSLLTSKSNTKKEERPFKDIITSVLTSIIVILLAFLMGYFVHLAY